MIVERQIGTMALPVLDITVVMLRFAWSHWLAILTLAISIRLIYFRFFHPLAKVPGEKVDASECVEE